MVGKEDIDKLQHLLPVLPPGDIKFASSLINSFHKWGSLSPKQEPWVAKLIERAENPQSTEPPKLNVGNFNGVVALFHEAQQHLKYPKIVLACEDKPIILSIAGKSSKYPGSINITGEGKYPTREWYGRVSPEGQWTPALKVQGEFQDALVELLQEFSANPAEVAKKYGKLTGNCCFCGLKLTDPRSTAAGFGPVCAEHYGLSPQWKAAVKQLEETVTKGNPPEHPTVVKNKYGEEVKQDAIVCSLCLQPVGEGHTYTYTLKTGTSICEHCQTEPSGQNKEVWEEAVKKAEAFSEACEAVGAPLTEEQKGLVGDCFLCGGHGILSEVQGYKVCLGCRGMVEES